MDRHISQPSPTLFSPDLLDLPAAWSARESFTLLDLADPIGLRFVAVWDRWRRAPGGCARLHVVLLMPTLLEATVMRARLLEQIPAPQQMLVDSLLQQWPVNVPGLHRLEFDSLAVTLTLAVGPWAKVFARLSLKADALIASDDCWALPAEQWPLLGEALEGLMAEGSRALAFTSEAAWPSWFGLYLNFTAAQRIALPESATESVPVQSRRWLLRATVSLKRHPAKRPWAAARLGSSARRAVVVGAGLAGLHVAQGLALRGWRVTVVEALPDAQGPHAAHLAAALTPMVSRGDDVYARLSRAGSLRARARWSLMPEAIVTRCGALQLLRVSGRIVDLKKIVEGLGFSPEWVRFVDAAQASALAGLHLVRGGLYFPSAMRVQLRPLLSALAKTPGVTLVTGCVERISQEAGQWSLFDAAGKVLGQAGQVVLASGLATQRLLGQSKLLPPDSRLAVLYGVGGEITYIPEQALGGGPRCIVSGDGYLLPAVEGWCVSGSSYLQNSTPSETTASGRQENLARVRALTHCVPNLSVHERDSLAGWVGQRAVVPDRLPIVGPLAGAPGIWLATGFASRGLTWAALAADLIAGALEGEPLPLESDIIQLIGQN